MGSHRRLSRLGAVFAACVAASILGGTIALAGQQFTDVPPEHAFREDIEAIAAAGITTGFPDGTFRPGANVTRQAMAAFMRRGFGRITSTELIAVVPPSENVETYASVELTAGAEGEGVGGYVHVTGSMSFQADVGTCRCDLSVFVLDVTDADASVPMPEVFTDNTVVPRLSATSHAVFQIDPGETKTFQLRAQALTTGSGGETVSGTLVATYVPFDGTGNAPT